MSDIISISESENGVVRVFHIDLPPEAIERFTTQAGTGEWPLKYGLGAKHLSNTFVEVIDLRDLDEMPLSRYLIEAHGVSSAALKDSQRSLDSLKGHVLVLPTQAFGRVSQELAVRSPIRWIGTFEEIRPATKGVKIQSKASEGLIAGGPGQPGPASSGKMKRFAIVALAVVAALVAVTLLVGRG